MNPTTSSETGCPVDILFVDDSANLRRTIGLWLETQGYSAVAAKSAAEAEELAAERLPRIVITDLGLPDRSGYALIETLRKTDPPCRACFIAFSGDTDGTEKEKSLRAGFDHFIGKPPDFDELSKTLRCCLQSQSEEQPAGAN